MKKIFLRIFIATIAISMLFTFGSCSKHKGFKKDKSGVYYQFHGDIHDTADQPLTGDVVGLLLSMYTKNPDSTLIPMIPQQMLVESVYKGDLFDAIRLMHVGDSATFILDGNEFFDKMLNPAQVYEFGDEPLYFDVKLLGLMRKAEYEQMQRQYEAQLEEDRIAEIEEIDEYLKNNAKMKVNESGIYVESVRMGHGAKVEPLQKVKVHYTGSFIDGKVFDSSVTRGDPFEFTVGAGEVIPGWDATVAGMKVGDKVKVLIPSAMAYGPQGNYTIPPYSPLVFEIELLEIVNE